jgi:GNAT superfamily N-acetyltransferase
MTSSHPFPFDLPFTSGQIVVRPWTDDDVPIIVSYRNDPKIGAARDWALPFGTQHVQQEQLVLEVDGIVVGDIGVWMRPDGAAAVGYTLAPEHQGNGHAVEAVGAVADRLLASGVHRVEANTDPKNFPAMAVLERTGFVYEGRRRGASAIRGEWIDDDVFALLPADRAAWLARPSLPPDEVRLDEITPDMARAVARLRTHHSQERFVAPMWASSMDALVPELADDGEPLRPWYRAIVADATIVGFMMCALPQRSDPRWFLWRLLVDRMHQRRGVGELAILALTRHLRSIGERQLVTSWVDERSGPAPFYRRLGFVENGEMIDDEVVAVLDLGTEG